MEFILSSIRFNIKKAVNVTYPTNNKGEKAYDLNIDGEKIFDKIHTYSLIKTPSTLGNFLILIKTSVENQPLTLFLMVKH